MKRRMTVIVKGDQHTWGFTFEGDPQYIAEWRADGLEVYEVEASIPYWMAGTMLMRPWCWVQSMWRWMRLW